MERDDIFVGLPFSIKANYDDLKREIPRLEDYLDKINDLHASNKRKFGEISDTLSKLNENINTLFTDINGKEERSDSE